MSMDFAPLVRGRIHTIVENVNTVVTPGASVDVVVTEVGVAINPARTDLIEMFKDLKVPTFSIEARLNMAYTNSGTPAQFTYGEQVVALIEYRDGTLIDVVQHV